MLRVCGRALEATGVMSGGIVGGHQGWQDGQFEERFQLRAANSAAFQVRPNLDAFCNARSAGHCIIEITRQFCLYRVALHGTPSPAELARGDVPSEESVTRRAAE